MLSRLGVGGVVGKWMGDMERDMEFLWRVGADCRVVVRKGQWSSEKWLLAVGDWLLVRKLDLFGEKVSCIPSNPSKIASTINPTAEASDIGPIVCSRCIISH